MIKAIVKCIKSNGEEFDYIVYDDIINVVYTNGNITLVRSDGTSKSYANSISNVYKYAISFYVK